jgi:hypothetical protein
VRHHGREKEEEEEVGIDAWVLDPPHLQENKENHKMVGRKELGARLRTESNWPRISCSVGFL